MSSSFPGRIIFTNMLYLLSLYSSSNVTLHAKIFRDNFIQHLHTKKRDEMRVDSFLFVFACLNLRFIILWLVFSLLDFFTSLSSTGFQREWLLRVTVNWNENIPLQYLWLGHLIKSSNLHKNFPFFLRWFFYGATNLKNEL